MPTQAKSLLTVVAIALAAASVAPAATTAPRLSYCDFRTPQSSRCGQVPPPNSCHFRHASDGALLPDRRCTPGALNPEVKPATVDTTVCRPGYTHAIRPPTSYTTPLERDLLAAYGLPGADRGDYELDHVVPLEGGGAPDDPRNLFPQPYRPTPGAHEKDGAEHALRRRVCDGGEARKLRRVQAAIARDWTSGLVRTRLTLTTQGPVKFNVAQLSAKVGNVTIRMKNDSQLQHNVAIKRGVLGRQGKIVGKGGTSTVTAYLKAGVYTFFCSVDGHEAAGMRGKLIVK